MGTLYQPRSTTYVLPGGKYRTPDGQRVTSKTPGAVEKEILSKTWWGRFTVNGTEYRVKLSKNKEHARSMLAKKENDALLRGAGLDPQQKERHGRALTYHLEDWQAELSTGRAGKRRRPPSAKQLALKVGRVRRLIAGCDFRIAADITLARVQQFLQEQENNRPATVAVPDAESFTIAEAALVLGIKKASVAPLVTRHRLEGRGNGKARLLPRATVEALLAIRSRGIGDGTAGYYAREAKAFTRWLLRRKVLADDPLADLPGANPHQSSHRHDRRHLDEDELRLVLATAEASERSYRGLTGIDRAMLYATAAASGFRAEELASLVPGAFRLDDTPPVVVLADGVAKNGKAAVQPLPPDLAARLKTYLAGKATGVSVWPGTWWQKGATMLRIDLDACGIPYAVDGPEGPLYADFHSLRHAYVALLESAGISLKMAMQLARHSDPKLTMARYGRAQLHDLGAAVEQLPSLFKAPSGKSRQGADKAQAEADTSAETKAG